MQDETQKAVLQEHVLDYPVAEASGNTIAVLRLKLPITAEQYDLLKAELDHRLKVLAKMIANHVPHTDATEPPE